MTTDELLQRWSDGSITADELRELTAKLAEPDHQSALLDNWLLESSLPDVLSGGAVAGLRESEMSQSVKRMDSPRATHWTGWLQWRPLTAAAAGLVIGLFGASMVWAYAGSWPQAVALVRESFENGAMKLESGFPQSATVWSGDTSRVVVSEQGVEPKDGTRMLRLEPVKDMWNAQNYIVDLRQLEPAPAGAARVVRLAALFRAGPSEVRDRYMARAAAFVEAPGEIDPRWMNDLWGSEENHAVATAARAVTFQPGAPGWQSLNLTMDLPPGSRFLAISLRAATMHGKPEMRAAHYLDDVRVTLETLQTREAKP